VVIQKYGGSSVATPDKIKSVARRIAATKDLGHDMVVVVSAMGNTTDELLALAQAVSPEPERRELDMLLTVGERISMTLLSMSLHDLGYQAVSFTGSQSGIITTNDHTNARIIRVTPYRIQAALERGQIVIVAGFQGVSERKEITSLGRGGSDTTAVALAAALKADYAEICSDVDGVYSTDPRQVPQAVHLTELNYDEMQSLSDAGAKVLHAEAVEWARSQGIEVRCASTHEESHTFTRIGHATGAPRITGVSINPDVWVVTHTQCEPGVGLDAVVKTLSDWNVEGVRAVEFNEGWQLFCSTQNVHGVLNLTEKLREVGVKTIEEYTLVTAVGRSLSSMSGAVRMLTEALSQAGVSMHGSLIEPNGVGFIVQHDDGSAAVSAIHDVLLSSKVSA
jgi:aspartate kinase